MAYLHAIIYSMFNFGDTLVPGTLSIIVLLHLECHEPDFHNFRIQIT
jgi:hypothetical protein